MTDDIVKRLRDTANRFYLSGGALLLEAADEIERLRADAARYDWLREHTVAAGLSRFVHPHQFLDAAVDAAISQESR